MNKETKSTFAKWLEILQQESWQLELIISGFAIFLLLGAYGPISGIEHKIEQLAVADSGYTALLAPYYILLGAWYVLVINLVVHVLLRGLWISTIGLRYVSDDIDFDELKLNSKFDRFLRRRIVNFDVYIERLEKLCSIIFAFSFLIIFSLLSCGFFLGAIVLYAFGIDWLDEHAPEFTVVIAAVLLLIFLLGGLVYFLDFITLGWFKRRKLFARIYYPFYRFYSFITFAFIYRPLYYNLIDNRFGRRVVLFLIPYTIILFIFTSIKVKSHAYLPESRRHLFLKNAFYEDMSQDVKLVYDPSIPSKFIANGFIQLYLPYDPTSDDRIIKAICPDLKPLKTGTEIDGFISINTDDDDYTIDADSALLCNTQRYRIHVNDSIFENPTYRFHEHPSRETIGLFTILDVQYLPRGEHKLQIDAQRLTRRNNVDTLVFRTKALIPFWKE